MSNEVLQARKTDMCERYKLPTPEKGFDWVWVSDGGRSGWLEVDLDGKRQGAFR